MKVVIQRVNKASVTVDHELISNIGKGLLVFAGFEDADSDADIEWICSKIIHLRIFNDEQGKMNLHLLDIQGELLVVSQFTLHAQVKKGNRPSFIKAAAAANARKLYDDFLVALSQMSQNPIKSGIFGADMKVDLVNDGPVTIIMDSKNKE